MTKRAALALVFTLAAIAARGQTTPSEAGTVTALLPAASIERGAAAPLAAHVNDPLYWQDWFATNPQGRARLALADGSTVNVGSGARLQVVEHRQATEQTELELEFGKMRAEVKKRTQAGGRFRVKTNAAVVGVIGTHFYVDREADKTTVISFDGKVRVANADPAVAGEETLEPFELAEVAPGQPPTKRLATLAELLQALEDTLPGRVTRIAPRQARAGSCLEATSSDSFAGPMEFDPGSALAGLAAAPGGCSAPDITPVKLCLPPTTKPGVYEYSVPAADGSRLWGAMAVEPAAPLQDAWLLYSPELPAGATETARLVGQDLKPLAGVPLHVRTNGVDQTVTTDEQGGFTLHAPATGAIEVELDRAAAEGKSGEPVASPFPPLPPLRVAIKVVDRVEENPKLPGYSQQGTLVTVPGELKAARLGSLALPVVRTVTRGGRVLSSVPVPRQMPAGAQALEMEDPSGRQRTQPVTVYRILGGHLDQHALSSGAVTQGEFLVCVGAGDNRPRRVHARIAALGPVHFRGKGGKGKHFERTYTAQPNGLLRIPFQIQAEKGAPGAGIPFTLSLVLSGD